MGYLKWLGVISLVCNAIPLIASVGELEEAMQWMMMEQVSEHIKGSEAQGKLGDVEFVLYKEGPARGSPTTLDATGIIHNGALSARHDIRICVLGWQNDLKSEFVRTLVELYTKLKKNFQVVIVNWKGSQLDYVGARRSILSVAESLHKYLMRLQKDINLDLSKLTIVGHGFGAHIAGAAGHKMGGKIGTILALDPSGPLFWEDSQDTVNISSAKRVIGVHTSAGHLGVYWNVGHADFWVNRGTAPQPGCYQRDWRRSIVCSHDKSFRYLIEAVMNPTAFLAIECGKVPKCNNTSPSDWKTRFFSEVTDANGQFCFKTNPTSPYSLTAPMSSLREIQPNMHAVSKHSGEKEQQKPKRQRRRNVRKKKSKSHKRKRG